MKNISSSLIDNAVVFECKGNLSAAQVPQMAEALKEILREETACETITADLSQVEYIDTTGIPLISGLYRTLQPKGKNL